MFESYPDILNVAEVKSALGIGKNAVYTLIKNNQIKAIKIGNTYLYQKVTLLHM